MVRGKSSFFLSIFLSTNLRIRKIKRTLWRVQKMGNILFFSFFLCTYYYLEISSHFFLLLNKYFFLMYVVLDSHKISGGRRDPNPQNNHKSLGARSRLTAFIQSSKMKKNLPRSRFPWLPLYHQFRVFLQITISLQHNSIFHNYCFDAKVITDFNT